MARVHHVKAARKDYPNIDVKKGEPYYWWAFRFGGKHMSKTPPAPSQLTQSEFLSSYYSIQENLEAAVSSFSNGGDIDDLISEVESSKDELESLKDETEEKASNVEQAFPGGSPVLDTLQQRVESLEETVSSLEEAISELESLRDEHQNDDDEEDEEHEYEVGDQVVYQHLPYKVTSVMKNLVEDGVSETVIEITDGNTLPTTIRLTPSMCTDLEPTKEDNDDSWRSDAESTISNIDWSAE